MLRTHKSIDERFSGRCLDLIPGRRSIVSLKTEDFMKADEKGLVHGGFTFSVADYAAMIAVNHPNVVLLKALVKFTSPVKVGDTLIAKARLYKHQNNRCYASVEVFVEEKKVFEGKFVCLVLESHVFDPRK
ncbi:MAG: hotdog domain-containing protein [Nitrososphaeria archaeon]|jgi:acyl-coenzyme A thioesterase PaaI-like protein